MNYCVYHRVDFDGMCSAAIVKHYFDKKGEDIVLYGINYGDDFTLWDKLDKDDTVYMVDFGLQPFDDMILLNQITNLIWIDHHATAISDVEDSDIEFQGIQKSGIGACQLVWEYLFPNERIPYAVRLLAEYDVWIFDDLNTLPFQYGMRIVDSTKPDADTWKILFSDDSIDFIQRTVINGGLILMYEDQQNAVYCSSYAKEIEFEGYKVIAMNRGIGNSKLFDSIWDDEKYDFMMVFAYSKKGHWNIGMYTDKEGVHVGKIAKKYGGGGHAGAAGCQVKELPFDLW